MPRPRAIGQDCSVAKITRVISDLETKTKRKMAADGWRHVASGVRGAGRHERKQESRQAGKQAAHGLRPLIT